MQYVRVHTQANRTVPSYPKKNKRKKKQGDGCDTMPGPAFIRMNKDANYTSGGNDLLLPLLAISRGK